MKKKLLSLALCAVMLVMSGVNCFAENGVDTYTVDTVIEKLGEMLNYGVFTKEIATYCHTESTIAAEKATALGEYGFSSNNFNMISNKLTVNYDAGEKELTLVLLRNGAEYAKKNVKGAGSEVFDRIPGGSYEAKLMENGEYVSVGGEATIVVPETYSNVSYIGKLDGTSSIGMPVGPGVVLLNDKDDYENNKNYNARQNVSVVYTENTIDFDANLGNASEVSKMLANAKTGGSFKVYNLTSSTINSNDVVNNGFKSDGYDYILINLDMTGKTDAYIQGNYKRDNKSLSANFSGDWKHQAKMIYNIYTVENGNPVPYTGIVREQNPLTGILLAPEATVYGAGNHGGIIIAGKYFHTKGEVHQMRADAESFNGTLNIFEKPAELEVPAEPEIPDVLEVPAEPEISEQPEEDESIHLKNVSYAYIFGYEPIISFVENENGEKVATAEVHMAMDDAVTVEQVCAMLMRMLDQTDNTKDVQYPMTPAVAPHAGQWYERGLSYLCSVGGFDPETPIKLAPITRGEVAKLVACALKLNLSAETPFTDIEGSPYKEYIEKVYKYDYMHGQSDSFFGTDAIMTRAEFCNLFNNIIGRNDMGLIALDKDGNQYEITAELYSIVDMNKNHWAYNVCLKATSAYDENGYVDVETRTSNIRNILDQYDAQKWF